MPKILKKLRRFATSFKQTKSLEISSSSVSDLRFAEFSVAKQKQSNLSSKCRSSSIGDLRNVAVSSTPISSGEDSGFSDRLRSIRDTPDTSDYGSMPKPRSSNVQQQNQCRRSASSLEPELAVRRKQKAPSPPTRVQVLSSSSTREGRHDDVDNEATNFLEDFDKMLNSFEDSAVSIEPIEVSIENALYSPTVLSPAEREFSENLAVTSPSRHGRFKSIISIESDDVSIPAKLLSTSNESDNESESLSETHAASAKPSVHDLGDDVIPRTREGNLVVTSRRLKEKRRRIAEIRAELDNCQRDSPDDSIDTRIAVAQLEYKLAVEESVLISLEHQRATLLIETDLARKSVSPPANQAQNMTRQTRLYPLLADGWRLHYTTTTHLLQSQLERHADGYVMNTTCPQLPAMARLLEVNGIEMDFPHDVSALKPPFKIVFAYMQSNLSLGNWSRVRTALLNSRLVSNLPPSDPETPGDWPARLEHVLMKHKQEFVELKVSLAQEKSKTAILGEKLRRLDSGATQNGEQLDTDLFSEEKKESANQRKILDNLVKIIMRRDPNLLSELGMDNGAITGHKEEWC